MSTTHLGSQPVVIPTQLGKIALGEKRLSPNRSNGITVKYENTSSVEPDSSNTSQRQQKLEPIGKGNISLAVLKQYNQLVAEKDEGLTCRSLPPVKLSVKMSKTKFVDTPKGELTSRILKPQLTMKTHTAGHHVFTEGISKKSKIPNPTFALPQMKIPYSNLPDNIMIFKEKNKFAFGVKNEAEPSPYRLAPKPIEETSLHLNLSQLDDTPRFEVKSTRPAMTDRGASERTSTQYRGNKVVLDPIVSIPGGHESTRVNSNGSNVSVSCKVPMVPNNSMAGSSNNSISYMRRNSQIERGESRLSVVSIGDTITPDFFERNKKQTRKLYPMYDYRTRRDEFLKMSKFGGTFDSSLSPTKPEEQMTGFTYKISSRSLDVPHVDPLGAVSPIRNNLQNRPGPLINAPRGLGSYRRYARGGGEFDGELSYQEHKLRKFYNRRAFNPYNPPRSAGSNNSADMYLYPANPPPSETSHIVSEDVSHNFTDFRKDIVPLVEEREKTGSLYSANVSHGKGTVNSRDDDNAFVSVDRVIDEAIIETGRTIETDTDIQMEAVISKMVDERGYVKDPVLPEDKENSKSKKTENKEKSVKENSKNKKTENGEKSVKENTDVKVPSKEVSATVTKDESGSKVSQTAQTQKGKLSVPTFTLEKLTPNPVCKEKTSLSRSIQNMLVSDKKPTKADQNNIESASPDKLSPGQDMKVACSVTRLRLFSEASTDSLLSQSIHLNKENREETFDIDQTDLSKPMPNHIEKKLVANSNIQFISPLIQDKKAKRQ